jgi:hypothetical protein
LPLPGKTSLDQQHPLFGWLYKRLTRNDPPEPADLIFVFAGRMDRKRYGRELYQAGLAAALLLSVGRFEVSKMRMADFPALDKLISLRDRTAPGERHFFCEITASSGIRIARPKLRKWNTYAEVLALREFLAHNLPRSLILVSTDLHLRRITAVFETVFREAPVEVRYCPVPPSSSSVRKEEWWTRNEDRTYVFKETIKLAAYRAILTMPEGIIRRVLG